MAVTGHGFGHATRTAEVLRELVLLCPSMEVTVSSTVPRRFFDNGLGSQVTFRSQAYEPGTVQKSCFEVDLSATRLVYRRYLDERKERLQVETEFLSAGGFDGVLADIPAIPVAAARACGIRVAGLWNFTWDWILEPIVREARVPDPLLASLPLLLHEDYAAAGLHLRLPFSAAETTLPNVEDVPLVGRKSRAQRHSTLEKVGMSAEDSRSVVLVAMGGWECRRWDPIKPRGCEDFRFLVVGDVPIESGAEVQRIPARLGEGYAFCDLVAAADLVLSKPGYGIASECVVNRTPLLGVERRGFREAPELSRDLSTFGPFREISLRDFFAGRWAEPLQAILEDKREWRPIEENGAQTVAKRLRDYFQLG